MISPLGGPTATSQVFSAAQTGLLDRKGVPMHRRLGGAANGLYEPKSRDRRVFVEQFFRRERREPEILPPCGFVLPPVPVQHVVSTHHPCWRLLGRRAC